MRTRQSFYEKPLLLFFLLMIFVSSTVTAQGAEKISMKLTNLTIEQALEQITKQNGYSYVIKSSDLNMQKKTSVDVTDEPIREVLYKVFEGQPVSIEIVGKSIRISKENRNAPTGTSQKKVVKGTVTDETNQPVAGVNVVEQGTTNGTITDMNGNYSLEVSGPNAVLQYSFIGSRTITQKVGNQTSINVVLQEDSQALSEVVVVGFGTQKKVNLTGSVSTVASKALESRPVANVSQALQGLVPGLNFSYAGSGNGGELNNDMKLNIRGGGTIGDGSKSSPLVLIDGMEGDMNALNPQDIESVSVLKDAAASSIYGSRAPFGVILITTKKGSAGKISVNYNNSFRWSSAINTPDIADSYTYAQYFNRAAENMGETGRFTPEWLERIKAYQEGTYLPTTVPDPNNPTRWDWQGNSNNDWYDIYFNNAAFSQEHAVSANGGSEKYQFYVSANYLDQSGLLKFNTDKMQRYTVTGKINAKPTDWLSFNYSSKFIRNDYKKPSAVDDNVFYHNIAKRWPMEPFLDPNGHGMSMAESLLQGGDYKTQKDNLYQQFQLILEPIKDWKIFGELNYRTTTEFLHKDVNQVTKYDVNNNPWTNPAEQSSVLEQATKNNFFNPNVYTEYFKELNGGHAFKVMVGFQAELNKYRELGASRTDMITSNLPTLNTSTGTDKITKGGYSHWATAGFFGRINYNYKERYLLEVNARYDGTSRFSRDNRWNVFPSVSAGWNIAREAFWEPYTDVVNNLKLRGSWGELGNQNTTNLYPYYQLLKFAANDANSHWLLNGMKPNTANAPDLISTLLSWETMRSWNIGIDVGALQNRLTFSFDYFNRKTLDMVGPAPELPVILGATVPKTNNADMESKGFELDIAWRDRIGKVDYGAHILLSDDRQRVTRYSNPTGTLNTWYEGQYSGEIWGYVTHGIAKTDEEMQSWLANHKQSFGNNWAAGDVMYEDLNGDGEVNEGSNTITDPGDKKIIGNSSPRYKFGIDLDASWKGFDIRMFFQGVAKRDYWLGDNMFWGASGGLWQSTCFTDHLDFFRSEGDEWGANPNAYFPRPILDGGKNQKKQTRYLQNAAYLRMKNLQIGYTLPAHLTSKAGLSKLRIFLSVENLFTISGLPDSFDPETLGSGYGNWNGSVTESAKSYPLSRTVSTGLSVTF